MSMYVCDGCDEFRDEDFNVPEEIDGNFYCQDCVCNMPDDSDDEEE